MSSHLDPPSTRSYSLSLPSSLPPHRLHHPRLTTAHAPAVPPRSTMASVEDLSRKYSSQLSQVRAIFPEWEDQDLLFALSDAKGSLEDTVLAISEGQSRGSTSCCPLGGVIRADIPLGRASQFTQATRKKPTKSAPPPSGPKGIRHSNQNADSAGWDDVNAGEFGRPGRGGRGGMRGGRGGARGGRGGGGKWCHSTRCGYRS